MESQAPTPQPGRGKPTVAAGVFLLAFLASATMMVWTGLQLWRGEVLPVTWQATPAGCQWVMSVEQPRQWRQMARALPDLARVGNDFWLPAPQEWKTVTLLEGLDADSPWTVCGLAGGVVVTAVAPQAPPPQAAQTFAERTGTAVAFAHSGTVLRAAFPDAGHTGAALLTAAAALSQQANLGADGGFRTAAERVGAGDFVLYWPAPLARERLRAVVTDPFWRDGIDNVTWLALAFGRGAVRHAHLHVGVAEAGAAWLKAHLDLAEQIDVAPVIDATAVTWTVARLANPALAHVPLAPTATTGADLLARVLEPPPSAALGTLVIQTLPASAATTWLAWTGPALPPPGMQTLRHAGWQVAAAGAGELAIAGALLRGERPSQAQVSHPPDGRRLLTRTQGNWDLSHCGDPSPAGGGMRLDWTWGDTGLAAELASVPCPGR